MDGPHQVKPDEYRQAVGLVNEAFRLSEGLPGTVLAECPVVLGRQNMSRMVVVSEAGRVVSHAAYQPQHHQTPRGEYALGAVSAVATDEEYRGRGFASSILERLDAMMRAESLGAAILWPSAPGFYRRLGYELAGEEFLFEISPDLFRPKRFRGKIRPFREDDLPAMHRLQRERPHKVVRAVEVFEALAHCHKTTIWVAELDRPAGGIAAYAAVGKGEDYPDALSDWAGDVAGILACIGAAIRGRAARLKVSLPEADSALAGELTDLGISVASAHAGMVKILDLGRLLASCCDNISGTQEGEKFTLAAGEGGESFETDDPGVVARLVFGPEPASELIGAAPDEIIAAAAAELPLPLHVPALDHV